MDLIFGMRVYDHKLQIIFEIRSGWMIFGQLTAALKFGQIFSCHHFTKCISLWFEILTWFLVWECIIISYRSTLKFIPVEWFLANLQPFSLLLRELKKGETFASLNIHGGDIRGVPTHLLFSCHCVRICYCIDFKQKQCKINCILVKYFKIWEFRF